MRLLVTSRAQIKGMRCAVKRVLGEGEQEGGSADDSKSAEDVTSLVSQLREARSLLREQDAIMFAAIFDKCVRSLFLLFSFRKYAYNQRMCTCLRR